MSPEYFLVIKATAWEFYTGLALCLSLIDSPVIGFILFNTGSLIGFFAVVAVEISGERLVKGIRLFLSRTGFGRFLLRRKMKKDKQNARKKKKVIIYVRKNGALGLFFLSLLPIPYFTLLLVSVWLTLKVKNGLLTMAIGTVCKSSIAIVVVYWLKGVFF